ncbi:HD domain-containing protein [Actinokineospora auranticolor]|uniref:HD domain-containing protein n=1 Tax=Actinokineospora auranticolor TaxID=155976 RepID=A0A2S6GV19_9PSEU|nr:HD domain-containing protein [Actinokineospora auranticolor]PPK69092.1 HD domain-containing protein [Actinokineospora auranticolor]
MFTLEDAVRIARDAHEGQLDKAGRPYIEHPLRVMSTLDGDHDRMTAVLHDVIEDTAVTADDLTAAGCPPEVVLAVEAISKHPDESQQDYLTRVAANPMALRVKHADIADNSSPARLATLDEPTRERLRAKYAHALAYLASLATPDPHATSDA